MKGDFNMVKHVREMRFEDVKDKVVFRLARKTEKLVESIPHVDYLDMEVIFYIALSGDSFALITNELLEKLGVDTNDLMLAATENTPKKLGFSFRGILSAIAEYMGLPMTPDDIVMDSECPMYVATNDYCYNGSGVLLYENLMKNIAEKFQSDIYIIPCSVHELIIVKEDAIPIENISDVKDMISCVNQNEVEEKDVLSDSLYKFSRETGEITIIQ